MSGEPEQIILCVQHTPAEACLCIPECTYDKTNKNIFGMGGILALWRIGRLGRAVGILRMVWARHR